MRYQVPQFIEIEDRIFGQLTLKQFLYVAGGAAIGYIIWHFVPVKMIGFVIALPIVIFFLMLAFYKVNNKPFIFIIESALRYFFSNKLYIWKKEKKAPVKKDIAEIPTEKLVVPRLSDSKLRELTWGLDINEKLAQEQQATTDNRLSQ